MNTLVDELEGVPEEEIEKRERRWLGKNNNRGRTKIEYTSQ
jgi:hypothetical protein